MKASNRNTLQLLFIIYRLIKNNLKRSCSVHPSLVWYKRILLFVTKNAFSVFDFHLKPYNDSKNNLMAILCILYTLYFVNLKYNNI